MYIKLRGSIITYEWAEVGKNSGINILGAPQGFVNCLTLVGGGY